MSVSTRRRYCVFGCADLGAYMHGFPHPGRRIIMYEKWLAIVGNKLQEKDPLKVYKNKKVCSYHFALNDKMANHRLTCSAVPTLYLEECRMEPTKAITQKIINSPETCVDDNLRGVVATYPGLQLHPKHRVITVRNKNESNKVAVLGGGGSGHEPFASGFVGRGMLDGAVAGGVFASPPTGHVLYAIAQLYKYYKGGVIVIIGNYTGDRLNFGKAIEQAKTLGIKVEGLIVGEDVASSNNKAGGRSMVGEVFFYKLCGAMSAKGYDLATIRSVAAEANKYMATLGVCLSACSLPGQPKLFSMGPNELELGVGVHGEEGVARKLAGTAKEIVQDILDQVTLHLNLSPGARVAALIDNLGGTSFLEMNIISKETKDYLDNKQIKTERIYSGHIKTSLEMHGFQICLLHLNEEHGDLWLQLLDHPTGVASWPGGEASIGEGWEDGDEDEVILLSSGTKGSSGPRLAARLQGVVRGCLKAAAARLEAAEKLLNRLDSGCGDGDTGITLKKFAHSMLKYLETASLEYISTVLSELAALAECDMGGTSGGLYSLGLSAAAQAFALAESHDPEAWLRAWRSAMEAISKYGGAEPGDRTMLDTLHCAANAFEEHLTSELPVLLKKTAEAAENATQKTAHMAAKAGRASYVAAECVLGEDAGARAAATWLHAVLDHIATTIRA